MIVAVRSYPQGPRLWVAGQRVHHGATGCALVAAACARRHAVVCIVVGGLLALHDRHDWRVWFRREAMPATCQRPDMET
jgi:hypothetical protein